jgi:hypothetical protein
VRVVTRAGVIPDQLRIWLRGSAADEFCGWESIRHDLEFALHTVQILASQPEMRPHRIEDLDVSAVALWNSALTAYGRCFGTGTRQVLGQRLVRHLDMRQRQLHRKMLDRRDKHVAHLLRDNDAEHIAAFVAFTNPDDPIVIEAIGDKAAVPTRGSLVQFRSLIRSQLAHALVARDEKAAMLERMLNNLNEPRFRRALATGSVRFEANDEALDRRAPTD